MKNIGKPCAGIGVGRAFAKQKLAKLHARFDEGGQAQACSLIYLLLPYWDDVFSRLTQTPEWRIEALCLLQDPVYRNSQETRRFLDAQHQDLRAVLMELRLAK